jgi:hypothetical protein
MKYIIMADLPRSFSLKVGFQALEYQKPLKARKIINRLTVSRERLLIYTLLT